DLKFESMMDARQIGNFIITGMLFDAQDNLWLAGNQGIRVRAPNGQIRSYGEADGLPDQFVRAMWADRDGNIWAGTNGGLARLDGDRFVSWVSGDAHDRDLVRCLFEDREGDLWVGANNGLIRLRDDIFTVYGKPEG